ncbi:hypothetical protein VOLCADRAFT_95820 [Volvox carteri f. nagariensis]|uniref:Large ribosomal subunit protein uL15/eL18 domain-containing protein n=1 Tax=Volvox carteri f. nagariensis TaxID=3068 RepID=D8U8G6_VOLCA|eukprot:XP_002954987.1 hypothetical protein VOLCADRAFT_95820 [Volvox carteri f. nagariensis]
MSRVKDLLVKLGAVCQRSYSSVQAWGADASSSSSCFFRSIASSSSAPWRTCSLQHTQMSWSNPFLDGSLYRSFASQRPPQQPPQLGSGTRPSPPNYYVSLGNLRDNPGATRQRIRVGRGDAGRRNKYAGRGMKGQKSRGGPHMLFDGGQLGLLKFPVTRQRPNYEVLYYQLGLSRVLEYVQLGLLDSSRTITMKDLYDTGCVTSKIKYGVLLYGKARLTFPLDIQVTACNLDTRGCVESAGGRITRVYYTMEGLGAILHPETYTSRRLPLPLPAAGWHPKHDKKFDAIGQIPPAVRHNVLALAPTPPVPMSTTASPPAAATAAKA